jgi:hypothetical protein
MVVSVTVVASGARDIDATLWDWLRGVPELRGHLRRETASAQPGDMGNSTELVVALASTGAATALVTSLQVWLVNRHTDITVSVTVPGGQQVSLTAARAKDMAQVQDLLRTALESDRAPHPDPAAGSTAGDNRAGDGHSPILQ